MKFSNQYVILLSFLLVGSFAQSFAACPIDGTADSCSLAEFRQREFVPTFSAQPAIDYNDTPETRLKPSENLVEETLRDFGPKPADFNYDSGCQFGVCNTVGTDPLFLNR